MELLFAAASTGKRRSGDEAFLTGIMSLLGALLGLPMADVVKNLPVPITCIPFFSAHKAIFFGFKSWLQAREYLL
jgi:c-di-GMP-related signal transduction protein